MIVWEIVAYLADDATRTQAFEALREQVGLSPEAILSASLDTLEGITKTGGSIAFQERARRLQETARMTMEEFGGELERVLEQPPRKAKKALMKFPMVGEPGAEKILLFCGAWPVLALDSNGLRVLLRLGYGAESSNYSASYRSAQAAGKDELPQDCGILTATHHLLRRHGLEICKRNVPLCEACPISSLCNYYRDR
ncbi:MAG TPA: hypothetical protein VG944_10025 [Fimbriimonas sp.]|nr:hypothetical protein [Fimbriimonas sp.]